MIRIYTSLRDIRNFAFEQLDLSCERFFSRYSTAFERVIGASSFTITIPLTILVLPLIPLCTSFELRNKIIAAKARNFQEKIIYAWRETSDYSCVEMLRSELSGKVNGIFSLGVTIPLSALILACSEAYNHYNPKIKSVNKAFIFSKSVIKDILEETDWRSVPDVLMASIISIVFIVSAPLVIPIKIPALCYDLVKNGVKKVVSLGKKGVDKVFGEKKTLVKD